MEQLDTRAPVDCDDFLDLLHTKSMSHEVNIHSPSSSDCMSSRIFYYQILLAYLLLLDGSTDSSFGPI